MDTKLRPDLHLALNYWIVADCGCLGCFSERCLAAVCTTRSWSPSADLRCTSASISLSIRLLSALQPLRAPPDTTEYSRIGDTCCECHPGGRSEQEAAENSPALGHSLSYYRGLQSHSEGGGKASDDGQSCEPRPTAQRPG